jgi:DHA2 family multidrug resistance protein-like MFS transporter
LAQSQSSVALKATRREWIGLGVIALPCLLYSMDLTVLNLAVPRLSADLKPSSAQLLWIIDIYGFLVAGSLITMGTLGDRIGRRRLLLIGAAAFGAASIVAAFSTSAEMLIATRALLGVAGATLAPSTLSLIRNMFLDPHQRTVAIGVWVTSYSVGGAIGPLVGGVMLQYFWWGSVFLIGVPVMLLLLAVGPVLLPEFRDPKAGRLDLFSAALSLAAVLSVIYGLKRVAEGGGGWSPALTILAGLALGVAFVRRQRTLTDPLIDLRLFRIPAFSAALTLYMLGTLVAFGAYIFIAQYLQLVLGLTPLQAGLATVPSMLGFVGGSMVVPWIARRVTPASTMAGGLIFAAAGFGLLTQVDGASGLAVLIAGSVIYSLGISPVVILATDLIVGSAPVERAGAASAISETSSELGGALGIALLGSIGVAVYRGAMADGVPIEVPAEAAEAARATLGGAVAVAERLPEQVRLELLGTARAAFARAFQLTAAISGAIALVLAPVALVLLRRVGGAGGDGGGGAGNARGPKRLSARSCALRRSSSRFRAGALVCSAWTKRWAAVATSSTARLNACSFCCDGRVVPLSLRTNWSADARISSSVAGGSKLASVLMLRHMLVPRVDLRTLRST